jgi:hypothetical protein
MPAILARADGTQELIWQGYRTFISARCEATGVGLFAVLDARQKCPKEL